MRQVRTVDRAVAVEVQERHVTGIASDAPEGVAERGQVQAVDRLVAVDVAEQAGDVRDVISARQTAGDAGNSRGQYRSKTAKSFKATGRTQEALAIHCKTTGGNIPWRWKEYQVDRV